MNVGVVPSKLALVTVWSSKSVVIITMLSNHNVTGDVAFEDQFYIITCSLSLRMSLFFSV